MSEQGDKARKALHDMRWGPHVDDPVERQEIMDDAIKVALGTVTALEETEICLMLVLDSIDFTSGACAPTEMIAACLPSVVLERAKKAVDRN